MPNSNTFDIRCIHKLIMKHREGLENVVGPFANKNRIANITNDLDPAHACNFSMDATDFLKMLNENSVDMVLYDPPYSSRQISECYKKMDMAVNMQTTQGSYWSKQKEQIGRIVKPGGICITFGWNSGGVGKKYGFEIIEILMVAHGGWHNDTICTVERKLTEKK